MRTPMRRGVMAVACTAFALVMAACSESQTGTPQGVGTPKAEKTTTSSPSTGKSTTAQTGDVDPCTLLSSSDATSLGFGQGKPGGVAGRKTCNWGSSGTEGVLIGLGRTSLDQLNGQTVDVGKHRAAKLPATEYGGCAIALGLGDSSNVTVVVTPPSGQATETACPKAMDVAKIIDPKLP
jgi:Protein of unknown function (DUF3558)